MTTTASRPAVAERSFQAAVVELAQLSGFLVYHTHDSRRSAPGFPDLTLVRDGRLLFAELKTEHGRLTAEQKRWLEALTGAGAEVHVWRPSRWEEIVLTLNRRGTGG